MSSTECLTTLKILIIGESGVGKTCLLHRFVSQTFDDTNPATVGVDFKSKILKLDDHTVRLALWDTAGAERFRSLTPTFYRNAQGAVVVYDVTNRKSFEKLNEWLRELDTYVDKPNIVKMIVGNKIDKDSERVISIEEGRKFAKSHAALFIEASAKTNDNVQCCFEELVEKIIQTPGLWIAASDSIVQLSTSNERRQQNCCTSLW